MLDQDKASEVFQRIQKYASADEVEVLFYATNNALTRFANNTIHQNVAEDNVVTSVRTTFGGRTARATPNKLDDESLRRVVQASESLAKVQQPDPDLLPVPGPSEAARVKHAIPCRYFDQTAAVTPQDRAETVRKIVAIAQKRNLTA